MLDVAVRDMRYSPDFAENVKALAKKTLNEHAASNSIQWNCFTAMGERSSRKIFIPKADIRHHSSIYRNIEASILQVEDCRVDPSSTE